MNWHHQLSIWPYIQSMSTRVAANLLSTRVGCDANRLDCTRRETWPSCWRGKLLTPTPTHMSMICFMKMHRYGVRSSKWMLMLNYQPVTFPLVCLRSGRPAVQPAVVEDQTVCVGASALRYLGWSFHHLYDQHLWCGAILAHRLPGG